MSFFYQIVLELIIKLYYSNNKTVLNQYPYIFATAMGAWRLYIKHKKTTIHFMKNPNVIQFLWIQIQTNNLNPLQIHNSYAMRYRRSH